MNTEDFDSLLVFHHVNCKYLPIFINKLVSSYSGVRLPKKYLRGLLGLLIHCAFPKRH